MAKEWYLLEGGSQLSGFESEALDEFGVDGFLEVLQSNIATDVELCNYDLSVCIPIRAIVQNNTADTKANTMMRQILFPIGTSKAGMYVKYKRRYWLIIGLVDDNKIYEKAVVVLCNYQVTWINSAGKIIQRWVSASSASQYNNGETSAKYYFVRSDQLMVLTPDDDECLLLNSGRRFIIDRRCSVYEKQIGVDVTQITDKPLTVYKITRVDSVLFNYQDSGHSEFMAYQDEQHDGDGYYVIDGKGYWLCDRDMHKDEAPKYECVIESEYDEIYPRIEAGVFTAKIYNSFGEEIDAEYNWQIESDIKDRLKIERIGKSIMISTDDLDCINHTISLTLTADRYASVTKEIVIRAFI